jgi:hypothetical protein
MPLQSLRIRSRSCCSSLADFYFCPSRLFVPKSIAIAAVDSCSVSDQTAGDNILANANMLVPVRSALD